MGVVFSMVPLEFYSSGECFFYPEFMVWDKGSFNKAPHILRKHFFVLHRYRNCNDPHFPLFAAFLLVYCFYADSAFILFLCKLEMDDPLCVVLRCSNMGMV